MKWGRCWHKNGHKLGMEKGEVDTRREETGIGKRVENGIKKGTDQLEERQRSGLRWGEVGMKKSKGADRIPRGSSSRPAGAAPVPQLCHTILHHHPGSPPPRCPPCASWCSAAFASPAHMQHISSLRESKGNQQSRSIEPNTIY